MRGSDIYMLILGSGFVTYMMMSLFLPRIFIPGKLKEELDLVKKHKWYSTHQRLNIALVGVLLIGGVFVPEESKLAFCIPGLILLAASMIWCNWTCLQRITVMKF